MTEIPISTIDALPGPFPLDPSSTALVLIDI